MRRCQLNLWARAEWLLRNINKSLISYPSHMAINVLSKETFPSLCWNLPATMKATKDLYVLRWMVWNDNSSNPSNERIHYWKRDHVFHMLKYFDMKWWVCQYSEMWLSRWISIKLKWNEHIDSRMKLIVKHVCPGFYHLNSFKQYLVLIWWRDYKESFISCAD